MTNDVIGRKHTTGLGRSAVKKFVSRRLSTKLLLGETSKHEIIWHIQYTD